MPFSKRTFKRKTFTRRPVRRTNFRSMTRFNRRMPNRIGNVHQKVYFYKRHSNDDAFVAGADGADSFYSTVYTLNAVPGYTEFTALYDFYKINKVVVKVLPFFSQVNSVGTSTGTFAAFSSASNLRIFSAVDYNDSTAPTTVDQLREYQNCKVTQYIKGHTRSFIPRVSLEGPSGANCVYPQLGNPWVATAASNIEFNALKMAIDTSLLPAAYIAPGDVLARVEVTYYISFKNPK